MSMPQNIGPQDEKAAARRKKYQTQFSGKSLTVQSDAKMCEMSHIMQKYRATGQIDHIRESSGKYGDFTSASDFQEAMNKVAIAQQSFEGLPSGVRKRFNNDPVEFLQFVHDPQNDQELVKMGLATMPKAPEVPSAPSTTPEPKAPSTAPEPKAPSTAS